ncbi:ubiquitin-conjugating enzyme E2 J1-like [Harmonia axyridis]|uniref:ubiquitin-conjugating enzyme E2 J1-like n=1 Tax=Harmonia axyridis TaxID=115357 RepID=UPI001E2799C2|nr:ubiquitin-conjugating enzyme E2 J1-like [Harmonia axyridis]
MSMESKYNTKSPGVKRLMREACELAEPTEEYHACPLEDNLFEWHFTVKGPSSTEFEGGYYHGRILLPSQYPMQPPNIILMTPNGRFEVNKKICLSISGHHPESWQPSWSIRTALLALIAFMPIPSSGTIGSLDYTPEERQILAKKSKNWECPICGKIVDKLSTAKKPELTQEESNMIKQIALKAEEEMDKKDEKNSEIQENVLRQRTSNNSNGVTQVNSNDPKDTESNNQNGVWNAIIGILLTAIVLLILRRILLL